MFGLLVQIELKGTSAGTVFLLECRPIGKMRANDIVPKRKIQHYSSMKKKTREVDRDIFHLSDTTGNVSCSARVNSKYILHASSYCDFILKEIRKSFQQNQ